MSYLHINNLYKDQAVLAFKRCYALEKIHGTSAHIGITAEGNLHFFSGGEKHERFVGLFNAEDLTAKFKAAFPNTAAVVYGEAYGGSQQGMKHTYGDQLKFIAFDVKVDKLWLSVPDMIDCVKGLGLELVHYEEGPTDLVWLDAQRDAPSVQAKRNGITEDKMREGIVIRPIFEVVKNNGERVIAKHKGDKFSERATPQKVVDVDKLKVLQEASAIAEEWVTHTRLEHVLQKLPQDISVEGTRDVIAAMIEDVFREAKGEIVDSPEARKAVGKKAAELFKTSLKAKLK